MAKDQVDWGPFLTFIAALAFWAVVIGFMIYKGMIAGVK